MSSSASKGFEASNVAQQFANARELVGRLAKVPQGDRGRDGNADSVEVLQTPQAAEALFKAYGKDPRYA